MLSIKPPLPAPSSNGFALGIGWVVRIGSDLLLSIPPNEGAATATLVSIGDQLTDTADDRLAGPVKGALPSPMPTARAPSIGPIDQVRFQLLPLSARDLISKYRRLPIFVGFASITALPSWTVRCLAHDTPGTKSAAARLETFDSCILNCGCGDKPP